MTGINSTVALRVSDINGDPLVIEGFLKNNHENIITRVTTNLNGHGKFDFEPSGFQKYKVVINWHGKEVSYPFLHLIFIPASYLLQNNQPGIN